jgi:hypothetical protein
MSLVKFGICSKFCARHRRLKRVVDCPAQMPYNSSFDTDA